MVALILISSVLLFSGQRVSVLGQCLDGFEQHGDRCYKAIALEASWIESKQYCRLLGSELLIVDDAKEESTVEGILTRIHGSHIDEVYWISGSDMITENDWRWFMDDGYNYPMNYTNWLPGRPDNSGGNENCLSIVYHGTRTAWNDDFCYERHSFICEAVYDGAVDGTLVG